MADSIAPLTFKQYLESKEQLRRAVQKTPQQVLEYTVKKYCKLSLGESLDEKVQVSLKPKTKIYVEWLYEDIDNPTPVRVLVEEDADSGNMDEYNTYWQGTKLTKWLLSNTRPEIL